MEISQEAGQGLMADVTKYLEEIKLPGGGKLVEVKAYFFGYREKASGESAITWPGDSMPDGVAAVMPTISAPNLQELRKFMPILGDCIRCMVKNIDSRGYELPYRVPGESLSDSEQAEADNEYESLNGFFGCCNADGQDITELRKSLGLDYWTLGRFAIEVVRNMDGTIGELYRIPQSHFYMTKLDKEPTEFEMMIRNPSTGRYEPVVKRKRFRRYFQQVDGKKVFFKEIGDPRPISLKDGKPTNDLDGLANECIFHAMTWSDDNPYGEPCWIGTLKKIAGFHKAEQTNYYYLNNRGVPEMMILVSGGSLGPDNMDILENKIKQLKGPENTGKSIILEAPPTQRGEFAGEKEMAPKIEIVPLVNKYIKDAMFQDYQKSGATAVRSSFGISPIILGMAEEHNQATARAALITAEQQTFKPEREAIDRLFNSKILAVMEINYITYRSLGNNTTDQTLIARALGPFKDAMPMDAIWLLIGDTMKIEMPDLDESLKGVPYFQAVRMGVIPVEEEPEGETEEEKLTRELRAVTAEKRKRLNVN
jgi:PBSX family phage portal protein